MSLWIFLTNQDFWLLWKSQIGGTRKVYLTCIQGKDDFITLKFLKKSNIRDIRRWQWSLENHLEREGMLFDFKQQIFQLKILKITIWQYVRQSKKSFDYILDIQLIVLPCTIFFLHSKTVKLFQPWEIGRKDAKRSFRHNIKHSMISKQISYQYCLK